MACRKRPPENRDESSSMDIGQLVVGDEPCTFVQVGDVLYRRASAGELWPKLIDIAKSLQVPIDRIISLETRIPTKMTTYHGALFEILEAWRGKFSAEAKLQNLFDVLEANGLLDCADALRNHFTEKYDAYVVATLKKRAKSSNWENLPENLKRWVYSKPVKFQGNENTLQELAAQALIPVDEKILDELGERKTPCIVNDNGLERLDYYVHRTVRSRNVLKIEVLKEKCEDVFVIKGVEESELRKHIPDDELTGVSGSQRNRLNVRFIILKHDPDFEPICKIATTPVHWVNYKNDRLEFFMSSGSVANLRKYIHNSQDSFIEEDFASSIQRVVVIADSPGMGKTSLLTNIAHKIMEKQPTMLVRFIVLKEFVDKLNNKEISMDSIVKNIAEKSSEYELGRKLVEHTLTTQKCVLLFDGLDEVLSNEMPTAMAILKAAVTLPLAQVYVTTRTHFRDEVENQFHVLAYTIRPFDKSNQINFLTNFWTKKQEIGNDELRKFASDCVRKLNSKMTGSKRKIAEIPLQCRLLAEACEEDAIRCSEVGYKDYDGADSVVIINSLFKIYESHMDKRFERIRKPESLVTHSYETIKQAHMYFALELLFPEHADKFKDLNTQSIQRQDLCEFGILEATPSNDIRFVHHTLAYFLVAMLAHENIRNSSPHRDILLSSILKLKREKFKIKPPISSTIELQSFDFCFPVICYFLNGFRKNENGNKIATDYPDEAIPYYIASARHNYENIPQIVTTSVANITPIETDEVFKRNIFYITASHSGLELMQIFCSIIDITQIDFIRIGKPEMRKIDVPEDSDFNEVELDEFETFIMTPLHVAAKRGHYGLVDYLLKKLEGKPTLPLYLMHFCVYDSQGQSNGVVEDKIQIIKLLCDKNKGGIYKQIIDQTTTPMQEFVHDDLLKFLKQNSAEQPAEHSDKLGQTHLVVGDELCTFVEVRDVLCRCDSVGKLKPKLLDIARILQVPTDFISDSLSLEKKIQDDTITNSGTLLEILQAWRWKFSVEAKLHTLINLLEINGLADYADELRIHIYDELKPTYIVPALLKSWMNNKISKFKRNEVKMDFDELTSKILVHVDETIHYRPAKNHDQSAHTGEKTLSVVGDESCPLSEVVDVIHCHTSDDELLPKLQDISRSLEVSNDSMIELQRSLYITSCKQALFEILESWRQKSSYNATLQNLIKSLEINGLSHCADSLRIKFKEFDDAYVESFIEKLKRTDKLNIWKKLPDHLKHWMNSKAVQFQGERVKLKHLTAQIPNQVDDKILAEMVEGNIPCIVCEQVPNHLDNYVHRTVTSRNVLSIEVLKEECEDVFVIEGMEMHKLSLLVPRNELVDVSRNQYRGIRLTVRFILLQHKLDFEKICYMATTPVHWVKYKYDRLEFFMSSGSVANLRKYILNSQDSFIEEDFASSIQRVTLIADSPGMGKTSLLTNIAHKIMEKQPAMLVRFIVLKEFVDKLNNKEINVGSIVKQIAEQSSEYEFGRKYMEHALQTVTARSGY